MTNPPFEINSLIEYLEQTQDDSWCTDVCMKGEKKCVMAHIFTFGGGDKPEGKSNAGTIAWDYFENYWATTYMIYPVNDGRDDQYKQATPKARCIQYIKDLRDGKQPTTIDLWEADEKTWQDSKMKKENIC